MFWYDHLYIGKKCIHRAMQLKYKITNGISHRSVYLIVLPQTEHKVLEIIPSICLLQDAYPSEEMKVIGISADRQEAMELVCAILEDVYSQQGNFDVTAFMDSSN